MQIFESPLAKNIEMGRTAKDRYNPTLLEFGGHFEILLKNSSSFRSNCETSLFVRFGHASTLSRRELKNMLCLKRRAT